MSSSGSSIEEDIEIPDNKEVFEENEEQGVVNIAADVTNLPKSVKEYVRKALRLNIHLSIYYNRLYNEYSLPSLLNVMVEEKYHK